MSEQLSQFQLLECDFGYIIEALLLSNGFQSPCFVSRKLLTVWHHVRSLSSFKKISNHQQCASSHEEIFSFRALKAIVASVAIKVSQSKEEFEKLNLELFLLREGILLYFAGSTSLSKQQQSGELVPILDEIFQNRDDDREWFVKQWKRSEASELLIHSGEATLRSHIEAAAKELLLMPRQALLDQARLLARGLVSATGVILAGPSGSGKTTAYQVLARTLDIYKRHLDQDPVAPATVAEPTGNAPNANAPPASSVTSSSGFIPEQSTDPFVDVRVVLPMALTLTQLYGSTTLDKKGRTRSVLGQLIRLAQEKFALVRSNDSSLWGYSGPHESTSAVTKGLSPLMAMQALLWIVFDGSMEPAWLEYLSCVMVRKPPFAILESAVLSFEDGECMTVPPNLHFVFETLSMQHCSPSILHLNAVVCCDGSMSAGLVVAEPIHEAYIHRYLLIQRKVWSENASQQTAVSASQFGKTVLALQTYDIVEKYLLGTELLSTIISVIEEYGSTVKLSFLQRVINLLSLLQVLLYSVVTHQDSETSLAPTLSPSETSATPAAKAFEDQQQKVKARLETRVEMACIYALMWGFAGCTSDNLPLQLLIQGLLKTNFERIADTWLGCGGRDCNLFETLIDIPGVRFVSVHIAFGSSSSSTSISHPLTNTLSASGANTEQGTLSSSTLFVSTPTSLLVHAIMKDALRAKRGVVLIGNENSRRTKLLRNFLHQVEFVNAILKFDQRVDNNASDRSTTKKSGASVHNSTSTSALSRQGSGNASLGSGGNSDHEAAKTLESVEKIRFHQISLVTALAAKFRRLHNEAMPSNSPSRSSNSTPGSAVTSSPSVTPEAPVVSGAKWMIEPGFSNPIGSAEMTAKFANGDFVPFFFTMNQHTSGVSEIAQCMERMLQRERTGVFEPPPGKVAILIIDDLHLPVAEFSDSQSLHTEHVSCHAYLRSAYEYSRVNTGDDGACIRIENLLMVASIAASPHQVQSANSKSDSLVKLVNQFFPVLAPTCTPSEIHHIYMTLTLAQWDRSGAPLERLPQTVRHALSLVVAGTTVLWEKLRRSPWSNSSTSALGSCSFSLHDLSRVYEGICSVAPAYVLDVDTLMRLWTHESLRTFGDPFTVEIPEYSEWISKQIWWLRHIMEAVDHRQHLIEAMQLSTDTMNYHRSGTADEPGASQQQGQSGPTNNLNAGFNAVGYLAYLSTEYLDKKPAAVASQQHVPMSSEHTTSLWGFVPNDLYQKCIGGGTIAKLNVSSVSPPTGTDGGQQQRNSIKFLCRKSAQSGEPGSSSSSLAGRWIYAELLGEDTPHEAAKSVVQHLFGAIRTFATTNSKEREVISSLLALQLPPHTPQVSKSLVRPCLGAGVFISMLTYHANSVIFYL